MLSSVCVFLIIRPHNSTIAIALQLLNKCEELGGKRMNRINFISALIIFVSAMTLFAAGCGGKPAVGDIPAPPPSSDKSAIAEGVMTTSVDNDSRPTSAVKTSFLMDTAVVYCSFKVSGVLPEDMIKASWYYVSGDAKGRENELINETVTIAASDTPSYYLAFYLDKPAEGWYRGSYKVVLSVNGMDKLSVPFSIE